MSARPKCQAKFAKYSVCTCGFPILSESVPLGAIYIVDPSRRETLSLKCGGCGTEIPNLLWIYVYSRAGGRPGFLPAEIFEIDEGAT